MRLFEFGSVLLFIGVLAQDTSLHGAGQSALKELEQRGYSVPTQTKPLTVEPLVERGEVAGRWRPGIISLRPSPLGNFGAATYLRHELMHEANHRTCDDSFPIWANEASAIAFSGEAMIGEERSISPEELLSLRRSIRFRTPLSVKQLSTVGVLVRQYGWPEKPCGISPAIEAVIRGDTVSRSRDPISFVLMSAISGRVFEAGGAFRTAAPVGSVLKLPYVASLDSSSAEKVQKALLASDTAALEREAGALNRARYNELVTGVGALMPKEFAASVLLGTRDRDGSLPITLDLVQAARLVRASVLLDSARFRVLRQQGHDGVSTLAKAPASVIGLLDKLGAIAKTGTVSSPEGEPIVGHIAVVWPAERPSYVAVFRQSGVRGADVADAAQGYLQRWRERYPSDRARVRVRVLSLLPKAAVEIKPLKDDRGCREIVVADGARITTCGAWSAVTNAQRARPIRVISGILSADGGTLEEDVESYTDGVVASEGASLPRAAETALRAVIAWNGTSGGTVRHPDNSLCDTTHCMVFRGSEPQHVDSTSVRPARIDWSLVRFLLNLVRARSVEPWLPFSIGGDDAWKREVSGAAITQLTKEPVVLDVRRERTRSGEVRIRIIYPGGEEAVPCEKFMTLFDLPSCPDRITHDSLELYSLSGVGRGHGEGLRLSRAASMARAGASAESILEDAYGGH